MANHENLLYEIQTTLLWRLSKWWYDFNVAWGAGKAKKNCYFVIQHNSPGDLLVSGLAGFSAPSSALAATCPWRLCRDLYCAPGWA